MSEPHNLVTMARRCQSLVLLLLATLCLASVATLLDVFSAMDALRRRDPLPDLAPGWGDLAPPQEGSERTGYPYHTDEVLLLLEEEEGLPSMKEILRQQKNKPKVKNETHLMERLSLVPFLCKKERLKKKKLVQHTNIGFPTNPQGTEPNLLRHLH